MSSGGLGNLVIRLGIDAADFTRGIRRSEQDVQSSMDAIKGNLAVVGQAFALVGVAGAAGLAAAVKSAIDAADNLNDLAQKTGIAVETLGGLGYAASNAGGSLEGMADAAGKLNKAIAGAATGNKEFQEGFAALGISVRDSTGQLKSADVILGEMADKFEGYADGPEKAAIAMRLLGKAGADQISLLNGGGQALRDAVEEYKKYSGVTEDVAKKSDQFNDTVGKINLMLKGFATTVAADMLPTLQAIADSFVKARTEGQAFENTATALGAAFRGLILLAANTAYIFGQVGDSLGATAAQLGTLTTRGGIKQWRAIAIDSEERAIASRKAIDAFNESLMQTSKVQIPAGPTAPAAKYDPAIGQISPDKPKPKAPLLSDGDSSKKMLDNQIKDLERQITQENDLFATRNKFIEAYNDDSLLAIEDYYAARATAQKESVSTTLALYDKEIAALKTTQGVDNTRGENLETQGRINDLLEKKAKLVRSAGEESLLATFKEKQAYDDLEKSLRGVDAQLLELQGQSARAARMQNFDQYEGLRKKFVANGDIEGVDKVDELEKELDLQSRFNELSSEAADIQTALANAEALVSIARQNGNTGDIEGLEKVTVARQKAVQDLQDIVAAQERLAKSSANPAFALQAETARVALEKLRSEADVTSERLNEIFAGSFKDPFADFISGSKTASEAFKSFANNVMRELSQIAAKEAATALFGGGGGGGGGGGNLWGTIFKAGMSYFTGGPSGGDVGITDMNAGLGGGGTDLSNLDWLNSVQGRAVGGSVSAGSMYQVNEKGPELLETNGKQFLMMGAKGGNVVPNSKLNSGGSSSVTYAPVINVDSRSDRAAVQKDINDGIRRGNAELVDKLQRAGLV